MIDFNKEKAAIAERAVDGIKARIDLLEKAKAAQATTAFAVVALLAGTFILALVIGALKFGWAGAALGLAAWFILVGVLYLWAGISSARSVAKAAKALRQP